MKTIRENHTGQIKSIIDKTIHELEKIIGLNTDSSFLYDNPFLRHANAYYREFDMHTLIARYPF